MKIYTKTGDSGDTGLFGGPRVSKDSPRIESYGTVDELNSVLGVVRNMRPEPDLDAVLGKIQNDLFALGAQLATPNPAAHQTAMIGEAQITALEQAIDRWQPDVVIAVDDDAQEFVTRHYVNHPRIRIVFAGVNGGIEPYGFVGAANVAGIFERKDLPALTQALLALRWPRPASGPPLAVHIGDQSKSV